MRPIFPLKKVIMSNTRTRISDLGPADKEKFLKLKDNKFFIEEYRYITEKMKFGVDYYKHVINNVNIDRSNLNNSYVMFIMNKVDVLDESKPVKIIPQKSSLPDIDMDVPSYGRNKIIEHCKSKYGKDNVSQMVTFRRMKGGNSLKIVMRTMSNMGFDEINEITKSLPMESKIVADLKEMEGRLGYRSIIRWALENTPNKFADHCELIDGKYDGPLAKHFELAIKLEGTIFAQSKHAAGVVISRFPLYTICPMIVDKEGHEVAGLEMDALADIGVCKFDILGLKLLDKITLIRDDINGTSTICSA